MIEGRYIREAFLADQPAHLMLRLVLAAPDPNHRRAQRLDGTDLHVGHEAGQADRGLHPEAAPGIGHTPPVVACGTTDHAPRALLRIEPGQRIGCTAHLERSDGLQRFEL